MELPSTMISDELVSLLREARNIVALTGAGISVESGLRTFRDPGDGLWSEYNPEEICTPEAYRSNARLVWEWHEHQREECLKAKPNAAHLALAELQKHADSVVIVTQNFDGLHQAAGNTNVLELHGSIHRFRCYREWRLVEKWHETDAVPPLCPHCGGPLRHDVVWFGESLPTDVWREALNAAEECDILISVGTSGVVQPAASLPRMALLSGAEIIIINPEVEPEAHSPVYAIPGMAGEILPALIKATWGNPVL